MSDLDPTKLKEDVSNLRFRWQNATKQYVDTYADKATGLVGGLSKDVTTEA